nr:DUF4091 domain-containing protein [bacterium]
MKASIVSANEWLYPDIDTYPSACTSIVLHAPRGGYLSVQVHIPATTPGDAIAVETSGDITKLGPVECYRLIDVLVEHNVGKAGYSALEGEDVSSFTTRKAPFRAYDAMQPFSQGGNVVEKQTTALYLAWPVAKDAVPGTYQGTVTVSVGSQSVAFPATLTVHKATMPDKNRLSITNWYSVGALNQYYHLEPYSERWFELYGRLMRLMQRTRQTHLIINLGAIDIKEMPGQVYEFDFSKIERVIRMAVEAGFQTLELGHIGVRNYKQHENIWLFYRPEGKKLYATSPEAYRFLAQFLPKWAAFLREHGWYDMAVQHVSDEPTMKTAEDYRMLSAIIRKFMPGVPLFDAIVHPELRGASDYWVPYNSIYQQRQEQWEELRFLGDQIWCYTCCAPGGKWLNRCVDMELLRPRLMHWGNYRFNLSGYLHWGFNFWRTLPEGESIYDHMNAPADTDGLFWPAGDTHMCYPGNQNGPWMSVRAERMRAGAEDCEMLYMIDDADHDKAMEICFGALRAFDDYTTDVAVFEQNYIRLLEACDAVQ